jgi:hypothetical protein
MAFISELSLRHRRDIATSFVDGSNPIIRAAFYNKPPEYNQPTVVKRLPILTFQVSVDDLTPRQKEGDIRTIAEIENNFSSGSAIRIYDGFRTKIPIGERDILTFIDTKTDIILASIIDRAKETFDENPSWSVSRKIFEICLLCFGNWGQARYPLNDFVSDRFCLGELIWTTQVEDFECMVYSLALQVVGQACELPITWYAGNAARFSHCRRGIGRHSCNLVKIENDKELVIDMTNYPPSLINLLSQTKSQTNDQLWEAFIKLFGNFPLKKIETFPPSLDRYYDLVSGDCLELGLRERILFYTEDDHYLFSSDLPAGWSL